MDLSVDREWILENIRETVIFKLEGKLEEMMNERISSGSSRESTSNIVEIPKVNKMVDTVNASPRTGRSWSQVVKGWKIREKKEIPLGGTRKPVIDREKEVEKSPRSATIRISCPAG